MIVSMLKWAGATAVALVGIAVALRLLLLLLDPLVPLLVVLIFMLAVFGILVRGR